MKERFWRSVVGVKKDSRVPKRAARREEGRRKEFWRMKASKPREKAGMVSVLVWDTRCTAMRRACSGKSMRRYVSVDGVAIYREKVQPESGPKRVPPDTSEACSAQHFRQQISPVAKQPSHCHCLRRPIDSTWLRSPRYVGSQRGLPRSSCAAMAPGEVQKTRQNTGECTNILT